MIDCPGIFDRYGNCSSQKENTTVVWFSGWPLPVPFLNVELPERELSVLPDRLHLKQKMEKCNSFELGKIDIKIHNLYQFLPLAALLVSSLVL